MAAIKDEFEPWLCAKLKSLKTDESIFGNYISGILETEDSVDEKKDALEGILSEVVVSQYRLKHETFIFFNCFKYSIGE